MNNKIAKFIKKPALMLLFLMLVLGVIACDGTVDNGGSSNNGDYDYNTERPEDPVTDTDIIVDGHTEYVVVIPAGENSKYINMAANELVNLMYEATGMELEIITDDEIDEVEMDSKYLSIGKTKVFKAANISATFEELGADGLKLYTYGDSVVMIGGGDRGTMYAVYEFLERQFNFECYASDEYYIDTDVESLKLKDFDVTEIPLFERRSVGLFCYTTDEQFRNRMRQEFYQEGWIYWSHSHFKILPPADYLEAHPDWYYTIDNNGELEASQLCLTNEEMTKEFTRVVIELVKNNPDATYISLGQQDDLTFCDCAKCTDSVKKYKQSGTLIRFINKVANAVQEYIDEYEPGREFYVSTFAYLNTTEAPLDENKKPLDPSVYPADNVRMMIAPIYACNCHNYSEPCNKEFNNLFNDWNVIANGKIFTWIYNKIFASYFVPFNNFSTFVQNYNILDSMGVQFVYHQGNKETEAGGMQELKAYVEAKLMWDNTLEPEKLVKDFCEHYYKDAGDAYYEYYKLIRNNYAIWETTRGLHCYNNGGNSEIVLSAEYWTRDLVDQLDAQFQEMFASIEKYKTSNPELYETLNMRIQKEYLTIRFFYLEYHFDELNYEQAYTMLSEFEYYCNAHKISVWRELGRAIYTERYLTSYISKKTEQLNRK